MTDEPYPEGFEEQYEVVDVTEAGIDVEKPVTQNEAREQAARIPLPRPPVKIIDGVRDSETR